MTEYLSQEDRDEMDLDDPDNPYARTAGEFDKLVDVRNITLPDRVMLPGPDLHLLYTHRRGTGLHSVYITSNYSQTWPSDPSIDPDRFTKFALHRLKLVLPFRYEFTPPETTTKVLNKIKKHSLEVTEDDDFDTTNYMNFFGVGGELVDVGVDHPIASLSHAPVDPRTLSNLRLRNEVGDGDINVKVASLDWLLHDLKDALFDVVGLPWKKKKAVKRLDRFLCMNYPAMAPQRDALGRYVTCLRDTAKDRLGDCAGVYPRALTGVAKEFFIGANDARPQDGYSLYSIMLTLPAGEAGAATDYLNHILAFIAP